MRCARCRGLMHVELLGWSRRDEPAWLWACFACGERLDYVILLNRRAHAELFRCTRAWAEQQLFRKVSA